MMVEFPELDGTDFGGGTDSAMFSIAEQDDCSSDGEAIQTVEDYLRHLDSKFFSEGIQSLPDRWQRVVASEGQYIQ